MKVLKCPVHKFNMEVKIAKEGKYKGQKFYVCPMYSDCKMSVKYDEYSEKVLHIKTSSKPEGKNISPKFKELISEDKLANLQHRKGALIRRERLTF
ncbi:MAG: hypothetical protein ACYCXQ_02325 [Candidatus Humimicrobiaceae bacterium]